MRVLETVAGMTDWLSDCDCITIDRDLLAANLGSAPEVEALVTHMPHLFSAAPVFISRRHVLAMETVVAAAAEVAQLPAYREAVLAAAPSVARRDPRVDGVFFGFDFHLGVDGPRLIEINTNAGGAMLNVVLAEAQRECCAEVRPLMTGPHKVADLRTVFIDMFRREWASARGASPLRTVALVDDAPEGQFLYPEFLLFKPIFESAGWRCIIADAASLTYAGGELRAGNEKVDLVYNRLTDFYFDEPVHAALRAAYEAGAVVVTPNPFNYALLADKRNLVRLTDSAFLQAVGASPEARATLLAGIPATVLVTRDNADALWRDRKGYFFKPVSGYGSKAAYRGDKLTKGTWQEILTRDYVAQRLIPPSERRLTVAGQPAVLKVDVRNYAYAGKTQLLAARLYQGQTTNFRTPGGGFAPVFTEAP